MRRIELDGAVLRSRDGVHDVLAQELALESGYGRNLDALHDVLCAVGGVELVLSRWPGEGDLARMRRVMSDAARENEGLTLTVMEE